MPTPIKGSTYKHPSFPNMSLFAQPVKGEGTAGWYTRVTFSRTNQSVRSLKLPYIPDNGKNKIEVEKKASQVFYELDNRHQQGLTNKRTSMLKLIDRFLNELDEKTKENTKFVERQMTPPHTIAGGKTPLDTAKWLQIEWVMNEIVKPFFQQDAYKSRSIDSLQKRDIEAWSHWRLREKQFELKKKWANGTLNKQNRVLRSFFKWAVDLGYMLGVPEIKEFKEDMRASRRPEMTEDQYEQLIEYLRKGYTDARENEVNRVYRRLFYLYICTIDATGIRPWNSPQNAIKKDDVKIKRDSKGDIESILITRREKGKEYQAVADRQWADIYDDILILHKAWEMDSEYLFAHPITKGSLGRFKNAPIGSFDSQWNNAMKHFGWAKKGDKQQNRISKYSLRHRYACRRYLQNQDISLEELAQIMGSSPRVLYQVYWHYKTEKNYKRLMAHGYERKHDRVRLFDDFGIMIGSTKKNTKKHIEHYNKHPKFTEKPTS